MSAGRTVEGAPERRICDDVETMNDHDDARESAHDVHDVLAAEEFGVGTADPALHHEPPHDVLAAEEFEVPAGDPALHRGPIAVPSEPGAGARAHDVLAADEFAVPAGPAPSEPSESAITLALGPRGLTALGAAAAALIALRRRRRR